MNRRLLINAGVSAAQVVIVGGAYFLLYRFLRDALGEELFGVWTLVLATTAAGSIANLGLAASAVKFVAQHRARGDVRHVVRLIQTAALSVGLFLALVLLAVYPLLDDLLAFFAERPSALAAALSILPYALVAFWLTSVAGVLLSSLDGLHRVDLRGWLLSTGTLVYLGLAFWRVPEGGLLGIAEAQVIQAALLLVAAWLVLRRELPALPWLPVRWHGGAFREMLGYSLNFQAISVAQLLLEPMAKGLLAKFGGMAMLTNFEFAYRMVFQVRNLLATAHQAVVPTIADLHERQPERLRPFYTTSLRLIVFLVLPTMGLLAAMLPVISVLWIERYEPDFVFFSGLLIVGWSVNLISNPAYFANLGTGALRWNVIGHVVMGVLCAGLGFVLGQGFGGTGTAVGYVVALIGGSLTVAVAYQWRHGIGAGVLVAPGTPLLAAAVAAGLTLALGLYAALSPTWPLAALALVMMLGYGALVALPAWRHPVRHQVTAWLAKLRPTSPQP